jgi:hypothetical protein
LAECKRHDDADRDVHLDRTATVAVAKLVKDAGVAFNGNAITCLRLCAHVCLCVCVCACMYVCMYVCVYVCMCECVGILCGGEGEIVLFFCPSAMFALIFSCNLYCHGSHIYFAIQSVRCDKRESKCFLHHRLPSTSVLFPFRRRLIVFGMHDGYVTASASVHIVLCNGGRVAMWPCGCVAAVAAVSLIP